MDKLGLYINNLMTTVIDKDEKFYIGTTRFTTSTYAENKAWRDKHNWRGSYNSYIFHSVESFKLFIIAILFFFLLIKLI